MTYVWDFLLQTPPLSPLLSLYNSNNGVVCCVGKVTSSPLCSSDFHPSCHYHTGTLNLAFTVSHITYSAVICNKHVMTRHKLIIGSKEGVGIQIYLVQWRFWEMCVRFMSFSWSFSAVQYITSGGKPQQIRNVNFIRHAALSKIRPLIGDLFGAKSYFSQTSLGWCNANAWQR